MTNKYRFERKYTIQENGCWIWQGASRDKKGYGQFEITENGQRKCYTANRFSMFLYRNFDLNSSLDVLHKPECHNRKCVNPEHLYIGTHVDNMRDKRESITHCKYGHEYTPENTMHKIGGGKRCRKCHNQYYHDNKE